MSAKKNNRKGRRGKYYTHVEPKLIEIEGWARDGLIDEQIAQNLGVAYSTFKVYKNKHSAFSAALKRGKDVVDREVENALLKRALGYSYDEITREIVYDEISQKDELTVTKIVTKEVNPDTTAQIFWLKNRKPADWRDRKEIEANITHEDPFDELTVEELRRLANVDEE